MSGPNYAPPGGGAPADANLLAESLGLVCWTVDPIIATFYATQANTHLVGVRLKKGDVISKLAVPVNAAGVGVTHAQLGIYSGDLSTVLAATADNGAAFQATGWVELPLVAAWTCPADGLYYLASTYTGATLPSIGNFQQSQPGVATLPGGAFRGVHAQVSNLLPAPAVSQGTFSNVPCIVAR